jgi:hypothetical protein
MSFYTYAAMIGAGISIVWVAWLFSARAVSRKYRLRPGYILSILQVALVLALMLAGFKLSDRCLETLNRTSPADTLLFRRVWLMIWAGAMIASIQVFLDIRRMASSPPAPGPTPARRPSTQADRKRPRRVR